MREESSAAVITGDYTLILHGSGSFAPPIKAFSNECVDREVVVKDGVLFFLGFTFITFIERMGVLNALGTVSEFLLCSVALGTFSTKPL